MERTRTTSRGDRSGWLPDWPGDLSLSDRGRVNINEDREVKYWTATLSCTKGQLLAAIAAVGTKPEWVNAHLKKGKV